VHDLSGANLSGADLSELIRTGGQSLSQEQLDQAWGNDRTKLPGRLTIPKRRTRETRSLRGAEQPKEIWS
jgi:uncharacterized protein YjbI with pentapeptide repeats